MRYDLWQERHYLGGAQTKQEATTFARTVADRKDAPVTIRTPQGRTVQTITPRGARNALGRAK
jgi:hypothetical protein